MKTGEEFIIYIFFAFITALTLIIITTIISINNGKEKSNYQKIINGIVLLLSLLFLGLTFIAIS
ncbi:MULTISPECIES: hypothetical protein [Tenacibaculum]|uniref:hypothetical protein n=1 Tax=Tenacibaculum TaxID=104267 RepID=UPI001E3616E4|nr:MULTISPECIES: hypothetical protein [Tenacibaculum]MCD8411767.1 hypothetical protein [Tenacibaculum finnmarkense genomovar ulcerans]MCG8740993.1 hypothetical protein [Tenacibaculum finnmarkense]MCG8764280.1 hypothetical protein [Tenacibaculum finnmarkense]MCG8777201.1 hypothetical protein [Tenacibaculum finnmarkense]MCM8905575.1 hypothetical protein [Tenacibaculum finnmarkense genomovar finnmarkense]